MSLVHRNRLSVKLGEYAVGNVTALVDALLVSRAQDYRRHLAARMMSLEPEDLRERLPDGDYHVSLKVDGEFNMLVYADGEVINVNPGGTVRVGLPFQYEACELLGKAGVKKALIAGELNYSKAVGKRPRVHDVSRVARQPASAAELENLGFAAFDIVEVDGVPPGPDFEPTWQRLSKLFKGSKRCSVVEAVRLKDVGDVIEQFRKWVDQGAEGAVIRSDAVGWFKVKPRHTIDAVVIGFTEGTDDRQGMVHDLLLALMRDDGCLHVLGRVGGGFDVADRRGFLSDLKDMIVESDYVEVNDQVAYNMVRPEWVIEISVLDMISQTTRNLPINRMVLSWDAKRKKFEIVRRLPLVGLISPQFIRRRDDKTVNADDLSMRQVTDLVELALTDRDARQLNLPVSQLLQREVRTKVLKGQTMVRKLVMWQTNKERDSDDHPAFVIHATDFSPNRKSPLDRDIRVSSSREQIESLWKELAEEMFTKGWEPAGATVAAPTPKEPKATDVVLAGTKRGTKKVAEPSAEDGAPPPEPAPKKRASPKKKKAED